MTELIITRGLPASGKTTWARAWVAEDPRRRARVNRDDIRAQLFGAVGGSAYTAYFSDQDNLYKKEEAVSAAERSTVSSLLEAGYSVVVDAMHLKTRYVRLWREVAADVGAEFRLEDSFLDTPIGVCIERDAGRDRSIGAQFIQETADRMQNVFRHERSAAAAATTRVNWRYEPDVELPGAWLFDIDGTLALKKDRSPYDYSRVEEDDPNMPVISVLTDLTWGNPADAVLVSGRDDSCREATERWLKYHFIGYAALFMRPAGDKRDDAIVKMEILRDKIAPRWQVYGVFDDRNRVVRMWRQVGLLCCQVAPGAF